MKHSMKMRSAVCIAALVAGGAAHADVTAQEVWDSWQEQMSMYAQTDINVGSEEMSGDTLVVTDLSVSTTLPDSNSVYDVDELRFEEKDGGVIFTMSEAYTMTFSPESGVMVTVETTQSGLEMFVSGDPDAMHYDVSADSMTMALKDIVDGDLTYTGDAAMTFNEMSGTYETSKTDVLNIAYDLDVASTDILVDFKIPGDAGEYVTGGGKLEGMNLVASMAMPLDVDLENPEGMFANGFTLDGGFTHDAASYIFDVNADGEQFTGSVSNGETNLSMLIDNTVVAYDVSAEDLAVAVTGSDVPFPIEIALEEYGVGFEIPVGKSEETEDFRLSFDLVGMTINEMIWGMIDPGNILPHDPATIQLALSGTAQPTIDMMNQEEQASLEYNELPFELNTLSLDTLNIAIAGAAVTGSGDFTFDPTDTQTFAPMPRPKGEASIKVNGLNQLIDNLIAMGLVPEEQVMGPRMMIGMFAQTTGEDQLETALEVNDEGHVLVNGQRVK